jgi:hypothetical protein
MRVYCLAEGNFRDESQFLLMRQIYPMAQQAGFIDDHLEYYLLKQYL